MRDSRHPRRQWTSNAVGEEFLLSIVTGVWLAFVGPVNKRPLSPSITLSKVSDRTNRENRVMLPHSFQLRLDSTDERRTPQTDVLHFVSESVVSFTKTKHTSGGHLPRESVGECARLFTGIDPPITDPIKHLHHVFEFLNLRGVVCLLVQ